MTHVSIARRALALTAGLAGLSLVAPVAAEPVAIQVSYADLDLSQPAGMATLDSRIHAAARQICGTASVRSVADSLDRELCLRQTRESVAVQIAAVSGKREVLALNSTTGPRR